MSPWVQLVKLIKPRFKPSDHTAPKRYQVSAAIGARRMNENDSLAAVKLVPHGCKKGIATLARLPGSISGLSALPADLLRRESRRESFAEQNPPKNEIQEILRGLQ
jgi:hypothetical protein